jgi:predicted PurR-regulated permease PerM
MLLFIVCILAYLTFQILRPFMAPIAWAVVFTIVFYPVYAYTLRYVKLKGLASFLTLLLMVAIIIGPFSYFLVLLLSELRHLAGWLESDKISAIGKALQHPAIASFIDRTAETFGLSQPDLNKAFVDYMSVTGKEVISQFTQGASNFVGVTISFVFMIFSTFFMFRDGSDFLSKARDFMPFSEEQKVVLANQVRDIIISTIYGGVLVALAQGIIGGVAFSLLGIPSPVLWGFAIAIASFVPLVGSFIIWGPSVVYLFAYGTVSNAFVMLFIGIFGISMIDYLLRPIIIGSRTKMHVFVILLSVLGGIQVFGLIGLVMGPLVVAVFLSVINIFREFELDSDPGLLSGKAKKTHKG